MSKTIAYRGTLPPGEQERIKLQTLNGKTGYRIVKFQIVPVAIFTTDYVCQIYNTNKVANITNEINFTDSDLLAVAVQKSESSSSAGPFGGEVIIFDNKKFNQDIFVTMASAGGFTNPVNYYIELETMPLSDIEATYMTLQNIRQITS